MFLRNPALLLSSRFIVGFTSACMVTTCVWGIAAEYSGTRRARALGISVALSTASSVTGTLLGGYLAQRAGWPLAFIQYPVFALAGLLLAWGGIGQVRPGREIPGATRQPYITGLLPFYLFTVLLFAVMFMGSTQFAFQLEADGITSSATRALIMGAITVVATVFSFCYGSVQQRLGALGAFTVGLASMAGALALIGLGSTMITAVLGAALMGIFVGLCNPYLYHH